MTKTYWCGLYLFTRRKKKVLTTWLFSLSALIIARHVVEEHEADGDLDLCDYSKPYIL